MISKFSKKFSILFLEILLPFVFISAGFGIQPEKTIEDLNGYFTGYNGCFILFDETANKYTIYNPDGCRTRVPPCSTFKIIHSLIGLETKVLDDENTLFKWDGTLYPSKDWNKDQTLASAVSHSVVWYFQQVALKVGLEREQFYIDKVNYGNKDISGGLTNFWLQSSLKISAEEQIEILRKFYYNQLPFSKQNIDIVKKILILSKNGEKFLSGKTGSGVIENKNVNGWFVGYIEDAGKVLFFASNIEGAEGATGYTAKEITLKILKNKNLF